MSAAANILDPIVEFYKNNTDKPYQEIYIEFDGLILVEEMDGFAADYFAAIRISQLNEISRDIPETCQSIE